MTTDKRTTKLTYSTRLGGGYEGEYSIFDTFSEDDVLFAFFPCVRFEDQILLGFRGEMAQFKKWTDEKKLLYDIKLHKELHENYLLVSKLAIVCIRKGLKLIIENPYSVQHYLRNYWCIKPKIIDKNRRENGDYLKKPTQYFFIGFDPKNNLVFEPLEPVEMRVHEFMTGSDGKTRQVKRSEMHPQYANRFIRQYILESED